MIVAKSNAPTPPFPRIVRDPCVLGGEPIVAGTRVPVRSIVLALQQYGSEERVLRAYPRITSDDLHQALDFYSANQALIDRYISDNEEDEPEPAPREDAAAP